MSELQEKLAKRRSQLTGHGLTPPPPETPKKLNCEENASLRESKATEPNGVVEKPVVPPVPVDTIPTSEEKNEQAHSSPDNWRDTPSLKLASHMMEEQPEAVSAVESEEDTGLAEALQQLNEKIRDSNDELKVRRLEVNDELRAIISIGSIDDFGGNFMSPIVSSQQVRQG